MGASLPNQVIDGIYDAALDPLRWPDALTAVGANFSGLPTHLIVTDAVSGDVVLFESTTIEPQIKDVFIRDYSTADRNPLIQASMDSPEGKMLCFPEIIGEKRFASSAIYNDLIKPLGVQNYMSAVTVRNGSLFAGFEFFAPRGYRSPSEAEVRRFESTARHLGRALKLSGCLGNPISGKTLEATLDRLKTGVFLVDREGHIAWHNRRGAALLARRDGLLLKCGRLAAERASDDRTLRSALARAADATLRITSPSGERSIVLQVHRLWHSLASPRASLAVFVSDPDGAFLSTSGLMSAFGLTSAEAHVALAVSRSHRIAEAAQTLGLSPNTIKAALKRVFAKTETRSQAELVRRIMSPVGSDDGDRGA